MPAEPTSPSPPAAPIAATAHDALPPGTRFGEFEISGVLGVGGFGIVYLAQDHALDRPVALKEYMPALLAARGSGAMVTIRSRAHAETYASGLRAFLNEARLLARFDHPALVKVYRVWEDNGTAYMVMPYLLGRTLRETRRDMAVAPDEAWLRRVIAPVLDALEQLHGQGVYHRDIAPDNIVLPADGAPVLLDLGAARRVIGEGTQSLTAIVKPSYAPIEQYAEMATLRQGPWTDLYALGAVLHFLLFGAPPAPAVARALQPDAEPIEARDAPGVSARFLHAVAWMLAVRPTDRPQNVAALRAVLDGAAPLPPVALAPITLPSGWATSLASAQATRTALGVHEPTMPTHLRLSPTASDAAVTASPGLYPSVPGSAPSTYVPPSRPVAIELPLPPASPAPLATSATSVPPPAAHVPSHRASWRRQAIAGAGAALFAAGLLWSFVGVIDHARPALSAQAGATVTTPLPKAIAPVPRVVAPPVAAVVARAPAPPPPAAALPAPAPSMPPAPPAGPVAPSAAPPLLATAAGATPVAARATRNAERSGLARRAPLRTRGAFDGALAAAPASARAACSAHRFIAYAMCVDRECERPRFRASADCVRMIADKRRREDH